MHQVELGLQAEITPDGARGGFLDRVGATGQLAPGGDGTRALDDRGDNRAGGDELHQGPEERLVLMLGVVRAGHCVLDMLEFEGGDA